MTRRPREVTSRAPFLLSVHLEPERVVDESSYPFSIPALAFEPLHLKFNRPVTILAGPNGSGKSTLIEALASLCGFGRLGGNRNYARPDQDNPPLARCLRASWLPKVARGFYTRAETISGLIGQIDAFEAEAAYGERSLTTRSHGEGYLEIFRNRLDDGGVFLLDEPEIALSPARQIEFLRILRTAEERGDSQFIIATHSPLLMAYPGVTLLHMTEYGIVERPFQLTENFRVLREFYLDPEAFMSAIFN